jgi:hypothetical protein
LTDRYRKVAHVYHYSCLSYYTRCNV